METRTRVRPKFALKTIGFVWGKTMGELTNMDAEFSLLQEARTKKARKRKMLDSCQMVPPRRRLLFAPLCLGQDYRVPPVFRPQKAKPNV